MHIRLNSTRQLNVEVIGVDGNKLFEYLPDKLNERIRKRVLFALQISLHLIADKKRDEEMRLELEEALSLQAEREINKSWGEL